jgi:hypothetical protein
MESGCRTDSAFHQPGWAEAYDYSDRDEKRLGPATTLYATVTLSFVIPSEAEGSAVLGAFRGNE